MIRYFLLFCYCIFYGVNADKMICTQPNEELKCVMSCPPAKTCRNRDIKFNCINIAAEVCRNECICKKGFYRNDKGDCVTSEMCDNLKCGMNEVRVENPSPCRNQFCPQSRESIIRPCPTSITPDIKLPPRCECRFNYSRAKNGTCIPTSQCPPFPCGPNEMFNSCPPYCPTDDCSQATPSGKCPIIGRIGIVVPCRPQCRCIKNYWRKNNVCVPFEQCNDKTMCTRPNEELKCVKLCPPAKTCQNRDILFKCINNATETCKNECICKKGFYRNNKGDCVTREMCDKPQCNKPNESLQCVKACPPARTCQNRNVFYRCFNNMNEVCKNKCLCNDGFYRNSDGFCVTSDLCATDACGNGTT